jgi:hypothetical protein
MTQAGQTPTEAISVSASSAFRHLSKRLLVQLTEPFRRVVSAGSSETLIQAMKRERQLLQLRVAYLLTKEWAILCLPGSTL